MTADFNGITAIQAEDMGITVFCDNWEIAHMDCAMRLTREEMIETVSGMLGFISAIKQAERTAR